MSRRFILGASLLLGIAGCDQAAKPGARSAGTVPAEELQQFIQQIKGHLIFVEGGEFLMGDYGPQRLPYDDDQGIDPLA